jgi:fructose-1,6-bisphosphatase/inositol monophosphatase family enzyme
LIEKVVQVHTDNTQVKEVDRVVEKLVYQTQVKEVPTQQVVVQERFTEVPTIKEKIVPIK